MKKAQVSIFIVIAVIIVAVIVIYLFTSVQNNENISLDSVEINNIQDQVTQCIAYTGEEAISFVGKQGGYYNIPNNSINWEIPYYMFNNTFLFPSLREVGNGFSLYVDNNLNTCIYSLLDVGDYNLSLGELRTITDINNKEVVFHVKYPITIRKGNKTAALNDVYDVGVEVRFKTKY